MADDVVIKVEQLSKRYLVGHRSDQRERYTALRDVVAREARAFARKALDVLHGRQIVQGDDVEEFWALKDVSFEVKRGEVLGIIGRNGAGKSTLLKILSRITEPTQGRVTLRGRVGSLLEVGTGFHPELTGRENIFLNGAILGMKRAEIKAKFDEIVAFGGVERFLDTPVKRYSSGMYVRLAFAVAAHLEPEILIVDEVLAVGDTEFQKKCLGKMQDVASHGRTVLFVSHQLGMVSKLCSSGILLRAGQVAAGGPIDDVIVAYQSSTADPSELRNAAWRRRKDSLAIVSGRTIKNDGSTSDQFVHTEPITLELDIAQIEPVGGDVFITVALLDHLGRRVFTDERALRPLLAEKCAEERRITLQATIPMPLLRSGDYSFILTINSYEGRIFDRHDGVCGFSVVDAGSRMAKYESWDNGPIMPPLAWR